MQGEQRVIVFIDADNVYWDARRAFHSGSGPASFGQIDPLKLGNLLVARGPVGSVRRLLEVRAYTGLPSAVHEPLAHAARSRQLQTWRDSGVRVFDRPLRYPGDWPRSKAEQKGVDVALAVDLVFGAARTSFDVAIVASTDTDLVPALEAICNLRRAWGAPVVEVAAWAPNNKRLRVAGGQSLVPLAHAERLCGRPRLQKLHVGWPSSGILEPVGNSFIVSTPSGRLSSG